MEGVGIDFSFCPARDVSFWGRGEYHFFLSVIQKAPFFLLYNVFKSLQFLGVKSQREQREACYYHLSVLVFSSKECGAGQMVELPDTSYPQLLRSVGTHNGY